MDADGILEGLRRGDPGAVDLLYDTCARRAFGLAYKILGDHGAAEDTVQDAFLAVWRNASRLDSGRGRLISLVLTVVHHKAIDRLRQKRGQPPLNPSADPTTLRFEPSDPSDLAMRVVDRKVVQEALSNLPPAQLQTVQLAYFEGYTHTEIADAMNVPLGTVKSRLRIALERLRSILQEDRVP